jgi:hypothetical protein
MQTHSSHCRNGKWFGRVIMQSMSDKEEHQHVIEPIMQLSETTVLYGCECGLEFEEVIEE